MAESPVRPPMIEGLDLRAWFAGCAISNPNVVSATDSTIATEQAFEVADKMMLALRLRKPPTEESCPPSTSMEDIKRWEERVMSSEKQDPVSHNDQRITAPAMRRKITQTFPDQVPDPNVQTKSTSDQANEAFVQANEHLRKASEISPTRSGKGFYSMSQTHKEE